MKSYIDIKSSKAVFAKNQNAEGKDQSSVTFVNRQIRQYPNHLVLGIPEKAKINIGIHMEPGLTNPKFSKGKNFGFDSA